MSNLKVVGAGLGRTGTKSLQKALEILGFDPCHHMFVVLSKPDDVLNEYATLLHTDDMKLLKKLHDPFQAAVDYPSCLYYKELLEMSPNAKVILTVRDSPEQWEKSVRNTIFPIVPMEMPEKFANFSEGFRQKLISRHGFDMYSADTNLQEVYTAWNKEVEDYVKPGNLLIMNPKDGWEPLCKFLDIPVPGEPFPSSNSKEAFGARMLKEYETKLNTVSTPDGTKEN